MEIFLTKERFPLAIQLCWIPPYRVCVKQRIKTRVVTIDRRPFYLKFQVRIGLLLREYIQTNIVMTYILFLSHLLFTVVH